MARYICIADLLQMMEEEVLQLAAVVAMAPVEARRLSRFIAEQRVIDSPESKKKSWSAA